jgi:hypothetical protein
MTTLPDQAHTRRPPRARAGQVRRARRQARLDVRLDQPRPARLSHGPGVQAPVRGGLRLRPQRLSCATCGGWGSTGWAWTSRSPRRTSWRPCTDRAARGHRRRGDELRRPRAPAPRGRGRGARRDAPVAAARALRVLDLHAPEQDHRRRRGLHPTVRPLAWWLERIGRVGTVRQPAGGAPGTSSGVQ